MEINASERFTLINSLLLYKKLVTFNIGYLKDKRNDESFNKLYSGYSQDLLNIECMLSYLK